MIHLCTLLFIFLSLISCVSVNVGPRRATPSKSVRFEQPNPTFKALPIEGLDRAWRDPGTGVTLGFLSECGESSNSLEQLQNDSWNSLKDLQIIQQKKTEFNARATLESSVEGSMDGVRVRMNLVVFRKNGCNYLLSFVGRPQAQNSALEVFESFKKGFTVP